ncbi:phage tail tape measure protein, partial [Pseudomonas aeruginosa]|nr:phage tail tape measure protein [Pseudomonas aeruginosa]
MARDLKLQVELGLIDKALGPIKAITQGSGKLAKQLKASRDQMKEMNQQQRDIAAYRTASIEITKQTRAMRDLQTKVRGHTEALDKQRTAHVNLKGNLKAAQTQYNKLSKALIEGKGTSAEFHRELEKAQIKLQSSQQAFTRSASTIKKYQDRIRGADTQLDQLKRQQQSNQTTLTTLKTKLDQAGIGTDGLGKKARGLRTEQDRLNTVLEQQKTKLAAVTKQQEKLARARNAYGKSQQLASNMAGAGAAGLATGTGMLYAGARIAAPGIEYGAQMSELQAVTRLDKSDERFKMLKQQARDYGASTAFSATEVGAGQTFLARAGFTPEAIEASMRDVLNLALANGTDLARTADIASNISSAFKIDPEVGGNITRVTDVLSGAAARANVDLEMLGDTMKYMGSAEGLGLSLEQAATMAGLLGNIGIQGSQAGTTMRAMLNRLSAPAKSAQKSIDALGLKVGDAAGNMRALPDILQDVATATANMGNIERAAHLKNIFGEEAGSGMAELVAQQGAGGLLKLLSEMQNVAGENARMAATRADNVDGDLKGLRSAWEEVGISITDVNEGPLREFIQSLTNVVRGVGEWIKANPALVAMIVKTAAGLGMLVGGMGALGVVLASILGPIAMIKYGMALFGIATAGALWPILAVIAAVVALGATAYAIYANWEGITAFFSQSWQEIAMDTLNFIGRMSRIFLDWNPLGLFYTVLADVLNWFGLDLPRKFTDFGVMMMQGLVNGIKKAAGAVKNAVVGAADSSIGWFKDKLGIRSPSRVFASLGGDTMAGLEQGLAGGEGGALKQLAGTAKRLTAAG